MNTRKKTPNRVESDDRSTNPANSPYEPTLGEIQARAYEAYVQRGRIHGFDLEDWLQAEKELKENGNNAG
jgi:hypothetical protein